MGWAASPYGNQWLNCSSLILLIVSTFQNRHLTSSAYSYSVFSGSFLIKFPKFIINFHFLSVSDKFLILNSLTSTVTISENYFTSVSWIFIMINFLSFSFGKPHFQERQTLAILRWSIFQYRSQLQGIFINVNISWSHDKITGFICAKQK